MSIVRFILSPFISFVRFWQEVSEAAEYHKKCHELGHEINMMIWEEDSFSNRRVLANVQPLGQRTFTNLLDIGQSAKETNSGIELYQSEDTRWVLLN